MNLHKEEQEKSSTEFKQSRQRTPTDTRFLKIKEITIKFPDRIHGGHIETTAYYVEKSEYARLRVF